MDSFLPLLLFFLFIALRFLSSRKPQRPPTAEPLPPGHDVQEDAEMDEALRQIREALGMPTPAPRPTPPPPQSLPTPRPLPPTPRPAPEPEFRLPAESHRERRLEAKIGVIPPVSKRPLSPASPAPSARKPVADLLKSPDSAEQAFLLSEIFGAPRARRR